MEGLCSILVISDPRRDKVKIAGAWGQVTKRIRGMGKPVCKRD